MQKVISKDGTSIAFDKAGQGPALILVGGALNERASMQPLAAQLAPHLTVFAYDRRGRSDSGDTKPYAVEREIEDIEALIDEAGGTAYLFGHSSGGALAMEATIQLDKKVKKLAMYEVPYNDAPEAQQAWGKYITELTELLAAGRRGDAVALFMAYLGMPAEQIQGMRHAPLWPGMEAIATTLAYDHPAILGQDNSVPTKRAASVRVPTLVMSGDAGYPFMRVTAETLAKAIPNAQLRILKGQTHSVDPAVLAPVLVEFFKS